MCQSASWRTGYVVVFILFIAGLVSYLDRVNVAVLIVDPVFLKDTGIAGRPDLQGLVMSVFLWVYGLTAIFLSFLLDRVGARKGLLFIAVVWALSMFLGGAAWSFGVILVSRVILGVGEGVQLPLNAMVVKTWAPPRERGMANSIWGMGLFFGAAVTMPLIAWLIYRVGWRISWFILGALPLVIVVPLVLIFVYNRPEESRWISRGELDYIKTGIEAEQRGMLTKKAGSRSVNLGWRYILTTTDYYLFVVGYILYTWLYWGFLAWLPSYLKTARGFTWAQMGALSSLPYLLSMISLFLSGYFMFRVRRVSVFVWIGCLSYGIAVIFALSSANNYGAALWLALGLGAFNLGFPAQWVIVQKIVPSGIIARAAGLGHGLAQTTGGFAAYLIGWLIAVSHGSYTPGFVFLVVVALLDAVIYFILYLREGRTFGIVEPATVGSVALGTE